PFQPRCPHSTEQCMQMPPLESFGEGRLRACFRTVGELA
ncbi:MAG: oligopeptide ABC transporter ATP-binding protein OppD, partial [Enterobacterales bacterium]|nr:oligopeptide ABC transporter ATP-binding protein OppD [Enterobacterales bacterium]